MSKNVDQGWQTKAVPLTKPFTIGEGEGERRINELTVYEPDMGMLEAIADLMGEGEHATVNNTIDTIAVMTKEEPATVRRLHPVDFKEVGKAMAPLLEPALEMIEETASEPSGDLPTDGVSTETKS